MTTPTRTTDAIVRENVKALLKSTRQVQADLAATMHLSQGAVSRRLYAGGHITLRDLDRIAHHFGITVAQLVTADFADSGHWLSIRAGQRLATRDRLHAEADAVG